MSLEFLNDQELYKLIRANNDEAFRVLYNRYWEVLYDSAFKRLADEFLVEEIVQETFINLYMKKESIEIDKTLAPYLQTVLKHKVIDQIRKNVIEQNYRDSLSRAPEFVTKNAHDIFERKELIELFNKFLETLPPKCQEVFILKRSEYSNKEISKKLNISEKTVEGHISMARKRMIIFFESAFLVPLICSVLKFYF